MIHFKRTKKGHFDYIFFVTSISNKKKIPDGWNWHQFYVHRKRFLNFLSGIAKQGLIFNLNFKFGWK